MDKGLPYPRRQAMRLSNEGCRNDYRDLEYERAVTDPRPALAGPRGRDVTLWRQRARDRAELAQLNDRDLRDARISRAALYDELAKPFWRG